MLIKIAWNVELWIYCESRTSIILCQTGCRYKEKIAELLKVIGLIHQIRKTGLPWCLDNKESDCNGRDPGLIPGFGRYPGEGNGYLFQYSCLENSMDRGALGLRSMGSQRVGHNWETDTLTFHIDRMESPSIEKRNPCLEHSMVVRMGWWWVEVESGVHFLHLKFEMIIKQQSGDLDRQVHIWDSN